ncbi:hypothetical protein O181_110137 [Austropuccinia psidii MF-1]|uniref:Uncharacterized protein n=1 Tax=Austropuccinia psidii MF-1 TaxID=1389203 RepID=A0A9Q3JZ71_9BASI|nr:hypothetical protein [Austropuccinia psidii MF-1]
MERLIGNQEETSDLQSRIVSQRNNVNKHEAFNTRVENLNSTQMSQSETQSQGSLPRRKHCTNEEAQDHRHKMEMERNLKWKRQINERVNAEAQHLHQVERRLSNNP